MQKLIMVHILVQLLFFSQMTGYGMAFAQDGKIETTEQGGLGVPAAFQQKDEQGRVKAYKLNDTGGYEEDAKGNYIEQEFGCQGAIPEDDPGVEEGGAEDKAAAEAMVEQYEALFEAPNGLCLSADGEGIVKAVGIEQFQNPDGTYSYDKMVYDTGESRTIEQDEAEAKVKGQQFIYCAGIRDQLMFQSNCQKHGLDTLINCAGASGNGFDLLRGAPSDLQANMKEITQAKMACKGDQPPTDDNACMRSIACNVGRSLQRGVQGVAVSAFTEKYVNKANNVLLGAMGMTPAQIKECGDTGQGDCLSNVFSGIIDNIWGTIEALWDGVKWIVTKGIPKLAEAGYDAAAKFFEDPVGNLSKGAEHIGKMVMDIGAKAKQVYDVAVDTAKDAKDVVANYAAQGIVVLEEAGDRLITGTKSTLNTAAEFWFGVTPFNDDTREIENRTAERARVFYQLSQQRVAAQKKVWDRVKGTADKVKAVAGKAMDEMKKAADTVKNFGKRMYNFIADAVSQTYGCKKWVQGEKKKVDGFRNKYGTIPEEEVVVPKRDDKGQFVPLPAGARSVMTAYCAEPFHQKCATCSQKMNNICGIAGHVVGELGVAFLTGGTVTAAKYAASGVGKLSMVSKIAKAAKASKTLGFLGKGAGWIGRGMLGAGKRTFRVGALPFKLMGKGIAGSAKWGAKVSGLSRLGKLVGKLAGKPIVKGVSAKMVGKKAGEVALAPFKKFFKANENMYALGQRGMDGLIDLNLKRKVAANQKKIAKAQAALAKAKEADNAKAIAKAQKKLDKAQLGEASNKAALAERTAERLTAEAVTAQNQLQKGNEGVSQDDVTKAKAKSVAARDEATTARLRYDEVTSTGKVAARSSDDLTKQSISYDRLKAANAEQLGEKVTDLRKQLKGATGKKRKKLQRQLDRTLGEQRARLAANDFPPGVKNASELNPAERIEYAQKVLGRKLNPDEAAAIQKAHNIGDTPIRTDVRGNPVFSKEVLDEKRAALKLKGADGQPLFSNKEITLLTDQNVVGKSKKVRNLASQGTSNLPTGGLDDANAAFSKLSLDNQASLNKAMSSIDPAAKDKAMRFLAQFSDDEIAKAMPKIEEFIKRGCK